MSEIQNFDVWSAMQWSERELIPASKVLICWKHDREHGMMDLLVTSFPNDQHYFDDYWDATSGACYSDWLKSGEHTMTPENVFGELACFYSFANKTVAEKAVVMFSRIAECRWARAMLARDSYEKIFKAGLVAHW